MTIPHSKLVMSVTLNKLKLKDAAIFDPATFSIGRFRQFLIDHANWPEAVIDEIEIGELKDIAEQISEAFQATAVPLASYRRSKTTHAPKQT
jgi:hypothetical protein